MVLSSDTSRVPTYSYCRPLELILDLNLNVRVPSSRKNSRVPKATVGPMIYEVFEALLPYHNEQFTISS